jgi:hypothetical protein|tara:strand:+ start:24 stop:656 length:633 start_codon:yes stop_codon:yes gene_type:complete
MSDKSKKTLGWNPTYFGEPKPGSLAAVIADVTTKQNAVVGEKPEVQSSAAVQAKEQQAKSEAMDPKANDKMDSSKDMRKKNKKDAEGEKHSDPVDIKGEDVNKEIEKAQQGKIKSLVDTIKDMYYSEAKQEDEGNAFGKALMAAKKNGEKEFVVGGKKYNVEQELDKVNPVAVKKKFKDRKDKDIDNDGDVDDSDRYLHKRRKAISKEID